MKWSLSNGTIHVSTDRRSQGRSTWVYDVSTIAIPMADEFKEIKDHNKAVALAQQQASDFVDAVRSALKLDENSATWYAPGQLYVQGDRKTHENVAALLKNLGDPEFQPLENLASLHELTSRRAVGRREPLSKLQSARRRLQVAVIHDDFGWQLLSAAAAGRLDLEALTELQIAWNDAATKEILRSKAAGLALRSLWMICEASQALPEKAELTELADTAFDKSQDAFTESLAALRKEKDDASAYASVLFSSLASAARGGQPKGFVEIAMPLLVKGSTAAVLAEALLDQNPRQHSDRLIQHVKQGVVGQDDVVLTALACRRAGGLAWATFRARSRQIVGEQPLRGHVVLLVNRLANTRLPIVDASASR